MYIHICMIGVLPSLKGRDKAGITLSLREGRTPIMQIWIYIYMCIYPYIYVYVNGYMYTCPQGTRGLHSPREKGGFTLFLREGMTTMLYIWIYIFFFFFFFFSSDLTAGSIYLVLSSYLRLTLEKTKSQQIDLS